MFQRANKKFRITLSELRGIVLVIFGSIMLGVYYSWWFMEGRLTSFWLVCGFIVALCYGTVQIFGSWVLYLATHHQSETTSPPSSYQKLSVDVFVTACGEDHPLIERALSAACAMRGDHKTWLLDDGNDPALICMARRLGAGYLTRSDRKDAKAGNLNAALARTGGDIVVIFDIDHAPKENFLEETLKYFAHPEIGFVQVMLTFENDYSGWIARAATESTLDFYNPTSKGANGLHAATLVGSNALIRRAALESIDGYKPGLAEDLATSIALHAAGWRSLYVSEPLAPGYSPPDMPSWFTQQLKWSRGVFELLITAYPRYFSRLNFGQKVSYAVRMTYYWIGVVTFIHLFLTIGILLSRSPNTLISYEQYLTYLLPLAAMTMIIRNLALRRWRHASLKNNLQWKPLMLVYATWPIYTLAWIMTVLRLPLSFRPTPKSQQGGIKPIWLMPQLLALIALGIGIIVSFSLMYAYQTGLVFGFSILQGVPLLGLFGRRFLLLLPINKFDAFIYNIVSRSAVNIKQGF